MQSMLRPRSQALAGGFDPSKAAPLDAVIDDYLSGCVPGAQPPMAQIVPHAGYTCSGPLAARGGSGVHVNVAQHRDERALAKNLGEEIRNLLLGP